MDDFLNKILPAGLLSLFISGIFFVYPAYAGTLSCSVTTAAACTGTVIWRMSGATNAHAELPSQATAAYANNVVCCSGVTGLGNSCSGVFATALKLSGVTNAHVQQTGSYAQSACISVPSGGSVSIGYQATDCATYDTTLASMKTTTNSHVGNTTAYSEYKICGTAAAGFSTAIEVRAQNYTSSVSSITFPAGAAGATVSAPYNNINGSGSPQTFGGAGVAKPVVTLYNGNASTLIIWYNITTFTNSVVSSENYLVNAKGAACADASCITGAVTFGADTTTGTTILSGAGNEKDFYLKTTLSSVAGKTGTSTLTILGEGV